MAEKKEAIPETGVRKHIVPKRTTPQPRGESPFLPKSVITARTPPKANESKANESIYLCQICQVEDGIEKIQCNQCTSWYHFTCAKLNRDVLNSDVYICINCAPTVLQSKPTEPQVTQPNNTGIPAGGTGSRKANSKSSTVSRRAALALQKLEEERQLLERREMEAAERQRERDKEYLQQKYSILEDDVTSNLSFDDQELEQQKLESIRQWTKNVIKSNNPLDVNDDNRFDRNDDNRKEPQMNSTANKQPTPEVTTSNMETSYTITTAQPQPVDSLVRTQLNEPPNSQPWVIHADVRRDFGVSAVSKMITNNSRQQEPENLGYMSAPELDDINQLPSAQVPTFVSKASNADAEPDRTTNVQKDLAAAYNRIRTDTENNALRTSWYQPQMTTASVSTVSNRKFIESTATNQQRGSNPAVSIYSTNGSEPPVTTQTQFLWNNRTEISSCQPQYSSVDQPQNSILSHIQLNGTRQSSGNGQQNNNDLIPGNGNGSNQISGFGQPLYSSQSFRNYQTTSQPQYLGTNQDQLISQPQVLGSSQRPQQPNIRAQLFGFGQSGGTSESTVKSQSCAATSSTTNHSPTSQPHFLGANSQQLIRQPQVMDSSRQHWSTNQSVGTTGSFGNGQQYITSRLFNSSNPIGGTIQTYSQPRPSSVANPQCTLTSSISQSSVGNTNYIPDSQRFNGDCSMNANNGMNQSLVSGRLTSEQIASRHVIPKELPQFDGDPRQWYKFISAYDNANEACGFSNSENLGRLQKCLKGEAEAAVSTQLLHKDCVPDIIATLKLLFGRPELIIETLVGDVQKTSAPKDDDLPALIKFAMSINNLSATIQHCGASEHLRNPMLINSIVDKLPPIHRMNWAAHKQMIGDAHIGHLGDWLYQMASILSQVVRVSSKSIKKPEQQKDNGKNKSTQPKSNPFLNTQVEEFTTESSNESSDNQNDSHLSDNENDSSIEESAGYNQSSFRGDNQNTDLSDNEREGDHSFDDNSSRSHDSSLKYTNGVEERQSSDDYSSSESDDGISTSSHRDSSDEDWNVPESEREDIISTESDGDPSEKSTLPNEDDVVELPPTESLNGGKNVAQQNDNTDRTVSYPAMMLPDVLTAEDCRKGDE